MPPIFIIKHLNNLFKYQVHNKHGLFQLTQITERLYILCIEKLRDMHDCFIIQHLRMIQLYETVPKFMSKCSTTKERKITHLAYQTNKFL